VSPPPYPRESLFLQPYLYLSHGIRELRATFLDLMMMMRGRQRSLLVGLVPFVPNSRNACLGQIGNDLDFRPLLSRVPLRASRVWEMVNVHESDGGRRKRKRDMMLIFVSLFSFSRRDSCPLSRRMRLTRSFGPSDGLRSIWPEDT